MAAVSLKRGKHEQLIDELRLADRDRKVPGGGSPVEVPTRQAAQELGVSLPT